MTNIDTIEQALAGEGRDDYLPITNDTTMKIHEYQAKQIFREHGVPVPEDCPAFQ